MPWTHIKEFTTVMGIDDAGFKLKEDWKSVPVFGVVTRGSEFIEGVVQTEIGIDSDDPTSTIIEMIKRSKQIDNIRAIFHSGITIAGFGVLDIHKIYEVLRIPVIIVIKKYPDYPSIKSALEKHFEDHELRWGLIKSLSPPKEMKETGLFVQVVGIEHDLALELIQKCTKVGFIPEPLRISHMLGMSEYQYKLEKQNR